MKINKNVVIIGVIGVLILVGIGTNLNSNKSMNSTKSDEVMIQIATPAEKMENTQNDIQDKMMKDQAKYIEYSKTAFDADKDQRRVYFFHATWCPSCKSANESFTLNPNSIPDGVVVFKADYDTETELKKKYNVTYQHTFVQVDESGNEVTKWSGGNVDLLIKNIK